MAVPFLALLFLYPDSSQSLSRVHRICLCLSLRQPMIRVTKRSPVLLQQTWLGHNGRQGSRSTRPVVSRSMNSSPSTATSPRRCHRALLCPAVGSCTAPASSVTAGGVAAGGDATPQKHGATMSMVLGSVDTSYCWLPTEHRPTRPACCPSGAGKAGLAYVSQQQQRQQQQHQQQAAVESWRGRERSPRKKN